MSTQEKRIDHLLGALSPEEKAGQLLVLGLSGTFVEPELIELVERRNISGLRICPHFRKFIRYLPDGSPGIQNVARPPRLREKQWKTNVQTQNLRASEFAALLHGMRQRSRDRTHGIPMHFAFDYEAGTTGDFGAPGLLMPPSPFGQGRLGDLDLIERIWQSLGEQLRAIGFDWIHSPVVDVNTNENNPEISTRSFGPDPQLVTNCARACLKGLRKAGLVATLKHYPGRGATAEDAHFGMSAINLDKDTFRRVHLEPYRVLCGEGIVPAVMPAHSLYPFLDDSNEIATVSKQIITGVLREEFGFNGVITTDSLTMGGLMAKYSASEAAVRAIEAGVDIVLLKDENALRWEVHEAITAAIKSGRLSEDRVAESLRRIWSTKAESGLMDEPRVPDVDGLDKFLLEPSFQKTGKEAATRCIELLRDRQNVLPLKPEQRVLVVDRITSMQLWQNDSWTYPGMFWRFMLDKTCNVSYTDYQPGDTDRAEAVLDDMAAQVDVIIATAQYSRGQSNDARPFLRGLLRHGKPVILISNNPYALIVPEEMKTVIVSYSLGHESLEALSHYLYKGRS